MDNFSDKYLSHEHSRETLDLLETYDAFLDSLSVICDMGAGEGMDAAWWASLMTRDDPPLPRDYTVFAVDKKVDRMLDMPDNVKIIQGDFEQKIIPRTIDLLWCHDAFQYAVNPLNTLKIWNEQMTPDGMLVLTVPQTLNYQYNRHVNRVYSGCYYQYTVLNLIYMLAVNGFDCKDSYMKKEPNDPWIHLAVYKSRVTPMDPASTSWYDLIEKGLIHQSLEASIAKYGHLRQEDIILPWLDRDWHFCKD